MPAVPRCRRPGARPGRTRTFAQAAAALTAVTVAGLSTVAVLTPARAATAPPAGYAAVCAQPGPGQYGCLALRRTGLSPQTVGRTPQILGLAPSGYGPADLQSAYQLPGADTGAGTGQRVFIIDAYDDPTAESDLAAYRAQYGLAPCTSGNGCFAKLNQSGAASPLPAGDTGWAGETSLDLDVVSATCPNCAITLVEANDATGNLFTAIATAVRLGARFVSMSWGGPESSGTDPGTTQTYLSAPGVLFAAASGDSGYSGGTLYPASSPKVLSVGGTSLQRSSAARGWSETAWASSSTEGAGSGCSAFETKPAFQSIVPAATCTHRATADVSAVADPATGVAVYQTYGGTGWSVYGGTSAATPLIAGVAALAGTPGAADYPNSYPYASPQALFDVTSGSTGTCSPAALCTAGAGWDGPTGLGTPDGVAAFAAPGSTPPSSSALPTSSAPPTTSAPPTSSAPPSSSASPTTSAPPPAPANVVSVVSPGAQLGTVGVAQRPFTVPASDSGSATLTWSASTLPAGWVIDPLTGVISGTPKATGSGVADVVVTDSTGATGHALFAWTIAAPLPVCTAQSVANPGFEAGSRDWRVTSTSHVISSVVRHAHAGRWFAWLDGYGRTHADSVAQTVSLPAHCRITMRFDLWVSTLDHTGRVNDTFSILVNGHAVAVLSNRNISRGYVLRAVDLSRYAGQRITITFVGRENASLTTNFLLDDVTVIASH